MDKLHIATKFLVVASARSSTRSIFHLSRREMATLFILRPAFRTV
jgi:hypothetical protein